MSGTLLVPPPPETGWRGLSAGPVTLRSLDARDLAAVGGLLTDLEVDYPGGRLWLANRLLDVVDGRAICDLAAVGGFIVGATIGTPKPHAMKLSTIFVAPEWRRKGVGAALLDRFLAQAEARVADSGRELRVETYVTVAHHNWGQLAPLLSSRGFTETAVEFNRYGIGRHEIVATRLSE
jgi:ribosomal protein S18 acetylase RimI-like enzyme